MVGKLVDGRAAVKAALRVVHLALMLADWMVSKMVVWKAAW